jgi:hypothetical protein
MASVVTINRPDVVALVEKAAAKLTNGNKTEVVALAMRKLLDGEQRQGSLFGCQAGSVRVKPGVDLTAPAFEEDEFDAETGREIDR